MTTSHVWGNNACSAFYIWRESVGDRIARRRQGLIRRYDIMYEYKFHKDDSSEKRKEKVL